MFEFGLQNSGQGCCCVCDKSKKQQNENSQVIFDCDRIFGSSSVEEFTGNMGDCSPCVLCSIREMCADMLKDIKRYKSKRKRKNRRDEKWLPLSKNQKQEPLRNDLEELYKCAGMPSDPSKVYPDALLYEDFLRTLKCLAKSLSAKKSKRENPKKQKSKCKNKRLKGGIEFEEDKNKAQSKKATQQPSTDDRHKAGAQKPKEQDGNATNENIAGNVEKCHFKIGKTGKECDVGLNSGKFLRCMCLTNKFYCFPFTAVGRRIIENMLLRLEQIDLKRMDQNECRPVPICDPCIVCPPCEPILPCDPCTY